MTELTVSNCTVAFGGLKAINDLTLTVPDGMITGLIGPNGSGKSTFCNMVSGQIPPNCGRIALGGELLNGQRSDQIVAAGLARTYQVPHVPKELTIGEVIGVPLRYSRSSYPLPQRMTTAADVASFCGLALALDTPCGELSVSDLRRLEIARALACRPRILLLDEAMAGLSVSDTDQVIALVREVQAAGITVVVIEHVMRIIASLCHHTIVLNNGALLSEGSPEIVLRDTDVREAYLGKGFTL